MFPLPQDLIGTWTGFIVHHRGATPVLAEIDRIHADGSLHGTYRFPGDPTDPGGEFTAELYGPWLFVRLSDRDTHGKFRFHVYIHEGNGRPMMYGAIPPAKYGLPFVTITLFRGKDPLDIFGAWQLFLTEGL